MCSEILYLLERNRAHVLRWWETDAADGSDVQSALGEITKRSTVPQVFIGGDFVGGCDGALHFS